MSAGKQFGSGKLRTSLSAVAMEFGSRRGTSGGGTPGADCTFFTLPSGAGRAGVCSWSELGRVGGVRFRRRYGGGGLVHGVGGGRGKVAIVGETTFVVGDGAGFCSGS